MILMLRMAILHVLIKFNILKKDLVSIEKIITFANYYSH